MCRELKEAETHSPSLELGNSPDYQKGLDYGLKCLYSTCVYGYCSDICIYTCTSCFFFHLMLVCATHIFSMYVSCEFLSILYINTVCMYVCMYVQNA